MKKIIFLLSLFFISESFGQWFYGSGKAVNLENDIGYNKNTQLIKSGVTLDPKVTPVNAGAGSLILKTDGSLYVKKDAGSTTNWSKLIDDAFLSYTPENVANKSTNTSLGASDTLYPSQNAVKSYVDLMVKDIAAISPIVVTQDTNTATISLGQIDYLDFNTAYSPSHLDGRVHYDQTDKTLSIDIDSANGVELQVGQEQYIRVVNKTGAPIINGNVVYISGAQGNRPTVSLALANTTLANRTIGVATQNIAINAEGMITTSGIVGGFNTSGFTAGDRLYLSNSVSGGITNILPADPIIQVGWALNSTISGKILVDVKALSSVGQSIVGNANNFYFDATASYADNLTLSTTPSVYPEVANTKAVTSGTSPVFFERFVSGALGRTSIPAGTWNFDIYAGTSNTAGLNEVKFRINKRVALSGCTGTFTGSGPTRTFTTSGCAPFVSGDANASILLATLIETPTQTAWITGYTSSSVVTVKLTDATFVNVAGTPFNGVYYHLFNTTTGDINSTSELKSVSSTQGAFSVNETDRIVIALFASTDQTGSRNITLRYGGTSRFSHFDMPSSVNHNDFANIQGGSAGEYYHTTANQNTAIATLSASGTVVRTTSDFAINDTKYFYFGSESLNGSFRMYSNGSSLIYEKRVSGSWSEVYRVE